MEVRRSSGGVVAALAALALAGPSQASASVEVGNICTGTKAYAGYTAIQLQRSVAGPLPLAAPTAGIATNWKVNSKSNFGGHEAALGVWRPGASAGEYRLVGQSAATQTTAGQNVYASRIRVQPGDVFGLDATKNAFSGGVVCPTLSSADRVATRAGPPTVGSPAFFNEEEEVLLALSVVIEPDADGDGWGDETQDGCVRSAAVQVDCPVVHLDASATPGRHSATVVVSTSAEAPVTVSGSVRIGARKGHPARELTLTATPQTVRPGAPARFTLGFPRPLRSALAALPRRRSLKLTIEATATDLTGAVSADATSAKLKGQAPSR